MKNIGESPISVYDSGGRLVGVIKPGEELDFEPVKRKKGNLTEGEQSDSSITLPKGG